MTRPRRAARAIFQVAFPGVVAAVCIVAMLGQQLT